MMFVAAEPMLTEVGLTSNQQKQELTHSNSGQEKTPVELTLSWKEK